MVIRLSSVIQVDKMVDTVIVTATGNVGQSQAEIIDATLGNIVRTLPDAATNNNRPFYFERYDDPAVTGNTVTIAAAGADDIVGVPSVPLSSQYEHFMLLTKGTRWYMFAGG